MIYLILVFSFLVRLINLSQSFWLDEAIQASASQLALNQFLNNFLPSDFNPPGFYLITHFWIRIFGHSEISLRMPAVILGTASLFIFYLILKKLPITTSERLITVLLFATAPLHIYYSQEARMYSLAVFSLLSTTLVIIKFIEDASWPKAMFLGLSFVLMSMSHYLTLLALPVFIFFLAYKKKLFNCKTYLAFAILLLTWAVYLPIFRSQIGVGKGIKSSAPVWHQIIGQPTLKSAALVPIKFVIGRVSIRPNWLYGISSLVLVIIYWGSAGLGCIKKGKYNYLFGGLLVFPILAGFLISFRLPVFAYFRFVFCLPFLYLLIGLSPVSKKIKYGLIILNLIFAGIYLFNPGFHRENWKGLAEWLDQKNQPAVYVLSQIKTPLEHYYTGKINPITNDYRFIDSSIHRNEVFLVSYGLPIFDKEDKIRKELKTEGLKLKAGESFNQVGIEIWEEK